MAIGEVAWGAPGEHWRDAPYAASPDSLAGTEGDLKTRTDQQPLPANSGTANSLANYVKLMTALDFTTAPSGCGFYPEGRGKSELLLGQPRQFERGAATIQKVVYQIGQ